MATRRRKVRKTRKRSCKNCKLKKPTKTKSGGKRRCRKKSRRRKTKSRRRKTKRKSKKRKYRMGCKLLEEGERCNGDDDIISLAPIEYDNYSNYYKLIDDGGGGQCFSRDMYEGLDLPKRSPMTRERIECPDYSLSSTPPDYNFPPQGYAGNPMFGSNNLLGRPGSLAWQRLGLLSEGEPGDPRDRSPSPSRQVRAEERTASWYRTYGSEE